MFENVGQDGMPRFMVSGSGAFGGGEDEAFTMLAEQYPVTSGLHVGCGDPWRAMANGTERRLVHEVGQVGSAHTRGVLGNGQ